MGRRLVAVYFVTLLGSGPHSEGATLDRHHLERHAIDGKCRDRFILIVFSEHNVDDGIHVSDVDVVVARDITGCSLWGLAQHHVDNSVDIGDIYSAFACDIASHLR